MELQKAEQEVRSKIAELERLRAAQAKQDVFLDETYWSLVNKLQDARTYGAARAVVANLGLYLKGISSSAESDDINTILGDQDQMERLNRAVAFPESLGLGKTELPCTLPGYVIAGPGTGKSTFAANYMRDLWARGQKGILISLEMTPLEMWNRIFAVEAFKRTGSSMGYRRANQEMKSEQYREIIDDLSQNIFVTKIGDRTPTVSDSLRWLVAFQERYWRPDVVVLDYLQKMIGGAESKQNDKVQLDDVIRQYVDFCKREAIPVVLLSQKSRGTEVNSIESGQGTSLIEHTAGVLITLQREYTGEDKTYDLLLARVLKNRRGGKAPQVTKIDKVSGAAAGPATMDEYLELSQARQSKKKTVK